MTDLALHGIGTDLLQQGAMAFAGVAGHVIGVDLPGMLGAGPGVTPAN